MASGSTSAGAFYAAPETPSRVLSKVGGVDVLFQSQRRSAKIYDFAVAVCKADLQTFGLQPSTRER